MPNAVDEILSSLDIDQMAQYVGAEPAQVEQAVATALPALFGGLNANAADTSGLSSILSAVSQHDASLLDGGVDLGQVDTQDGAAIAQHIFGDNTDAVYNQLGQSSAAGGLSSGLFRKLIPLLAPIVMSYLVKQMTQRTGGSTGSSGSSGGGLGDILGQVLGGGSGGSSGQSQQSSGGGLGDILGQVLGGGSSQGSAQNEQVVPQQAQAPQSSGQPNLDSILQDVLGGAASSRSQTTQASTGGSILTDILGGLLGGGRR